MPDGFIVRNTTDTSISLTPELINEAIESLNMYIERPRVGRFQMYGDFGPWILSRPTLEEPREVMEMTHPTDALGYYTHLYEKLVDRWGKKQDQSVPGYPAKSLKLTLTFKEVI